MSKVMDIIADVTEGRSFNSYKYSLDSVRTPTPNYDDNPAEYVIDWHNKGETETIRKPILLEDVSRRLARQLQESAFEPYLRYFLDGSRHVYHVDDISFGSRVFPVIAGQVGVACCQRVAGRMKVQQPSIIQRVISLPRICDKNGKDKHHEAFLALLRDKVNENAHLRKMGIAFDKILTYETAAQAKGDFKDRGVATIQDYMIDAEKGLVDTLARAGKFKNNAYLVKDGSLEYVPMKTGKYADIKAFKDSYRWVIGVSKSFNPELCQVSNSRGKPQPNAAAIIKLPQFCRTPVARVTIKRIPDIAFAVWYIRLRGLEQTKTPFDGVIKVEKILVTDDEISRGLETSVVDDISAMLINERNPTCYGADLRYANHLYPVYLTEAYVKSTYLSSNLFTNLF